MVKGSEHGLRSHEQHLKAVHHAIIQNFHGVLGFELDLSKETRQSMSMNWRGEGKQIPPAAVANAPPSNTATTDPWSPPDPDPRQPLYSAWSQVTNSCRCGPDSPSLICLPSR